MVRTSDDSMKPLSGASLARVAFPMGGMGTGMLCLTGNGDFTNFSPYHSPRLGTCSSLIPTISFPGNPEATRVVTGQVPDPVTKFLWGGLQRIYGWPRFKQTRFSPRFPFGIVDMTDDAVPLSASVTGWSPFIPGQADACSLPWAGLEYAFTNPGKTAVEAIFGFHCGTIFFDTAIQNGTVVTHPNGFDWTFPESDPKKPWEKFSVGLRLATRDATAQDIAVDAAWFRGILSDVPNMLWKDISRAALLKREPRNDGRSEVGASLRVRMIVQPGETVRIPLIFGWYAPNSNLRTGPGEIPQSAPYDSSNYYRPWYASKFANVKEVLDDGVGQYETLLAKSRKFSDALYGSTLPPEVIDAVAANLSILKCPTTLRQYDGRLWTWEGCLDSEGSCNGTCTHVYNYAQALPHLFPELERGARTVEFNENQDEHGHQNFRAALPIRPTDHEFHAALDGQLGGLVKLYRDWRISGDTEWLRTIWPKACASLDFCISLWDPDDTGLPIEPQHNTYDIEFWGMNGFSSSFYIAALTAAVAMGRALGEDVARYESLCQRAVDLLENKLFDGEYYFQEVKWDGLRIGDPTEVKGLFHDYSPEARELLEREGPKYQYGVGCLSDGVIGFWLAEVSGLSHPVKRERIESHLDAVFKYNFRPDLSNHVNSNRPFFALQDEGGLLLCSWPKGGALSLPFPYSNEVWTGIEYQVASHLIMCGRVKEGLTIVKTTRARYAGWNRNPFDEWECGHWYGRALASYALLYAMSGIRYDAVDKTLCIHPRIQGDFQCFFAWDGGFGLAGVRAGQPFYEVADGAIIVDQIDYQIAG